MLGARTRSERAARLSKTALGALAAVVVTCGLVFPGAAPAAGRHTIIADVDDGGGVLLATDRGGYYMGRLKKTWAFDRHGAWEYSSENRSNYAWSYAYGHSSSCLWVGPSRGKFDWTANLWASAVGTTTEPNRCTSAMKSALNSIYEGATTPTQPHFKLTYVASHQNCSADSGASHGTEKALLKASPFYWNLTWNIPSTYAGNSSASYDDWFGGTAQDPVSTLGAGIHVWYRYTTRDAKWIVAFVPGQGWGFFPIGAVDRTRELYDPNAVPGSPYYQKYKWSVPGGAPQPC